MKVRKEAVTPKLHRDGFGYVTVKRDSFWVWGVKIPSFEESTWISCLFSSLSVETTTATRGAGRSGAMIPTELKPFKVKSSSMLETIQCMYEQLFNMHRNWLRLFIIINWMNQYTGHSYSSMNALQCMSSVHVQLSRVKKHSCWGVSRWFQIHHYFLSM